jgi:hypothetical protein
VAHQALEVLVDYLHKGGVALGGQTLGEGVLQ